MKILLAASVLTALASCGGSRQWQHPGKSKHDFAIDDRECQYLAETGAKEKSLVAQPLPAAYYTSHGGCLQAKGWRPLETAKYSPKTVGVQPSAGETSFSTGDFNLTLAGRYTVRQRRDSSFLLEKDETYLYLLFQLDYPQKLQRMPPALNPKAVYFDAYDHRNLIARFYYQEVDHKLIFACTAHLYINDQSRIVVSLSKEFFAMPADFLSLPPEQFEQLLACQQNWRTLLDDLARQL